MATTPYLQPTTIQRVRSFLEQAAVPLPAWTGTDAVLEALWTTLRRRRDDPVLWARLAALIEVLERDVAAGQGGARLAHPSADPLAGERAAALVAELREALGTSDEPSTGRGAARRGMTRLSAPLVACLLLLAGACTKESAPVSTATDAPPPPPAAVTLEQQLAAADLPDDVRAPLASCFTGIEATQRRDLEALFRDQPPEEIARALEALLQPGAACHVEPAVAADATGGAEAAVGEPADATPGPADVPGVPYQAPPVPIYKGVSL
jgi:hypothetical protein